MNISNVSLTLPFTLHTSCLHMQVKSGSKTKNLVQYVKRKLLLTDNIIEQITWNAYGDGISKAIACAEMLKRQSELVFHEYVQIGYKTNEKIQTSDKIKLNKDIPSICILLSKIPLIKTDEKED
ncbi:unnamed protein product [Adineta steineri]|uniref:DNA/RNA-binding protein Alba-like domain-containing protein n=1 Tax=Adineta steineri TaxID=433720 RepID=A0A814PG71_9BILA|nr:unnamed protein product [Adineta steineri]CAF1030541.1 unnamed protein product [Adineta steineri]CAF1101613.1 unnamed protein product [Adineta steineri]CAF1105520.1 unnamed protein product [Adineta steineri]CAF1131529.1 unnamed protein product [Adineta steineri]